MTNISLFQPIEIIRIKLLIRNPWADKVYKVYGINYLRSILAEAAEPGILAQDGSRVRLRLLQYDPYSMDHTV